MSQEQATCLPLRERCDMARIGFFGSGRMYEAYIRTDAKFPISISGIFIQRLTLQFCCCQIITVHILIRTLRFYPIRSYSSWHVLWQNHAEVLVSKTITNMLLSYGT